MRTKIRVELAWVALTVIAASAFANAKAAPSNSGSSDSPATAASRGLGSLPASMRPAISATLGREDSRYRATPVQGGFNITNPGQKLSAKFTPKAASIAQGDANWTMSLSAYGYGENLHKASAASIAVHGNRVDYRRGSMTEWYLNGPIGVEQGFTLNKRPETAGISNTPLTLKIALSGNVTADVDKTSNSLTLAHNGAPALSYTGLTAYDAKGATMKAWMELQGANLLLHVDDRNAQYPLTVDPYVQTVILSTSDSGQNDTFGYAVAFNNDYAVVGAPYNNKVTGAVYVFAAPTSSTTTYVAKFTPPGGVSVDGFGTSVAIGNDDTIVVGAPFYGGAGAAFTFVKPTGGFVNSNTPTATLTYFNARSGDDLGYSVAISNNIIVAGAIGYPRSSFAGAAFVYSYPTGTTSFPSGTLTDPNNSSGDDFGWSVAAYNFTAVVSSPFINNFTGAAYLAEGSGYPIIATITAPDATAGDGFGAALSIDGIVGTDSDPASVVVGAPFHGASEQGAAYYYARPASGWANLSTATNEILSPDSEFQGVFGYSVALKNGLLAVGAIGANNYTGLGYIYDVNGLNSTLNPGVSASTTEAYFGWSAAVAPNGNVLFGAPYLNFDGYYGSINTPTAPPGVVYDYSPVAAPGVVKAAAGNTLKKTVTRKK